MATLSPAVMPVVINHHNGAPVFDIYANTQDDDLGSVAARINRIVKEESKDAASRNEDRGARSGGEHERSLQSPRPRPSRLQRCWSTC